MPNRDDIITATYLLTYFTLQRSKLSCLLPLQSPIVFTWDIHRSKPVIWHFRNAQKIALLFQHADKGCCMLHAKCKLTYREQLLLKPQNTNGLSALVAILPCRNSSEKFSCCGVKDLWSLILYVQRENCSNNSLCAYYAHIQTKSNTKMVLDLSAQIMVVSQNQSVTRRYCINRLQSAYRRTAPSLFS